MLRDNTYRKLISLNLILLLLFTIIPTMVYANENAYAVERAVAIDAGTIIIDGNKYDAGMNIEGNGWDYEIYEEYGDDEGKIYAELRLKNYNGSEISLESDVIDKLIIVSSENSNVIQSVDSSGIRYDKGNVKIISSGTSLEVYGAENYAAVEAGDVTLWSFGDNDIVDEEIISNDVLLKLCAGNNCSGINADNVSLYTSNGGKVQIRGGENSSAVEVSGTVTIDSGCAEFVGNNKSAIINTQNSDNYVKLNENFDGLCYAGNSLDDAYQVEKYGGENYFAVELFKNEESTDQNEIIVINGQEYSAKESSKGDGWSYHVSKHYDSDYGGYYKYGYLELENYNGSEISFSSQTCKSLCVVVSGSKNVIKSVEKAGIQNLTGNLTLSIKSGCNLEVYAADGSHGIIAENISIVLSDSKAFSLIGEAVFPDMSALKIYGGENKSGVKANNLSIYTRNKSTVKIKGGVNAGAVEISEFLDIDSGHTELIGNGKSAIVSTSDNETYIATSNDLYYKNYAGSSANDSEEIERYNGEYYLRTEPKTYELTINANKGSINGKNSIIVDVELADGAYLENYEAKRDGYLFGGWYDNRTASCMLSDQVSLGDQKDGQNITVYAGWFKLNYGDVVLMPCSDGERPYYSKAVTERGDIYLCLNDSDIKELPAYTYIASGNSLILHRQLVDTWVDTEYEYGGSGNYKISTDIRGSIYRSYTQGFYTPGSKVSSDKNRVKILTPFDYYNSDYSNNGFGCFTYNLNGAETDDGGTVIQEIWTGSSLRLNLRDGTSINHPKGKKLLGWSRHSDADTIDYAVGQIINVYRWNYKTLYAVWDNPFYNEVLMINGHEYDARYSCNGDGWQYRVEMHRDSSKGSYYKYGYLILENYNGSEIYFHSKKCKSLSVVVKGEKNVIKSIEKPGIQNDGGNLKLSLYGGSTLDVYGYDNNPAVMAKNVSVSLSESQVFVRDGEVVFPSKASLKLYGGVNNPGIKADNVSIYTRNKSTVMVKGGTNAGAVEVSEIFKMDSGHAELIGQGCSAIVNTKGVTTYIDISNDLYYKNYAGKNANNARKITRYNGEKYLRTEPNSYELKMNANKGTINGKSSISIEVELADSSYLEYYAAKRYGYLFAGWYSSVKDSCILKNQVSLRNQKDGQNIEVYAGWFKLNDGDVVIAPCYEGERPYIGKAVTSDGDVYLNLNDSENQELPAYVYIASGNSLILHPVQTDLWIDDKYAGSFNGNPEILRDLNGRVYYSYSKGVYLSGSEIIADKNNASIFRPLSDYKKYNSLRYNLNGAEALSGGNVIEDMWTGSSLRVYLRDDTLINVPDGKKLLGWSLSSDADSIDYMIGEEIQIRNTTVKNVYAVWGKDIVEFHDVPLNADVYYAAFYDSEGRMFKIMEVEPDERQSVYIIIDEKDYANTYQVKLFPMDNDTLKPVSENIETVYKTPK